MLMIVLCHIIVKYTFIPGFNFMGQILNVGVYSFLAISGYLYGGKSIREFGAWFRKRCITVVLPAFLVTIAVLTAEFCIGERHDVFAVTVYFLNLQGLGFLHPGFYRYFSEVQVLGPLWFITIIMLCYCMVPTLQKIRLKLHGWRHRRLTVVGVLVVCYIVAWTTRINTFYFLTFAVGYYLSARSAQFSTSKNESILLTLLMFVTQFLRLILRAAFDDTSIYQAYTYVSHMVLGIWIMWFFLTANLLHPQLISRIADHKWMVAANDISFYVYLTHYCFCRGKMDMYQLTDYLLTATVGFIAMTLIAAIVLKGIAGFLANRISIHFGLSI